MSIPTNASFCSCGTPMPEAARFCPQCGHPTQPNGATCLDQSQNQGGINAGGDVTIGGGWDSRVRMAHERDQQSPLRLAPELIAAVTALLGAGTGYASYTTLNVAPIVASLLLLALSGGIFYVSYLLLIASINSRDTGFALLPWGFGALERDANRRIHFTMPAADCPYCPGEQPGRMHVVASAQEGPQWQCSRSSAHHIGFDFTQMPSLEAAT